MTFKESIGAGALRAKMCTSKPGKLDAPHIERMRKQEEMLLRLRNTPRGLWTPAMKKFYNDLRARDVQ